MDPFLFIIAALAVYRISLMFTKEMGPFHIFEIIRKKMPTKMTKEWVSCIFCFSMTVSAFVCVLIWSMGYNFRWQEWLMLWFSFSAITVMLNQTFTQGSLK